MHRFKLECSAIVSDVSSEITRRVRRRIAPIFHSCLFAFTLLIPCLIFILNLPRGRQWLLGYESLCEVVTATCLFARVIMRSKSQHMSRFFAGLSFSLFFLSLAQISHASRRSLFDLSDRLLVQTNLCYCLAIGGICFVFVSLAKAARADILYWTSGTAMTIALYGVQYQYLLADMPLVTSSASFLVFARVYSGLCACAVAFAALHSLRTLDKFEFMAACLVMFMCALDFAARYNFVFVRNESVTITQCIWVAVVAGFSSMVLLRMPRALIKGGHPKRCAEWMSVRVIFGIFLFFANVVLLVSILVADLLIVKSTFHVTILLLLLIACWAVSNALSLKLSADMRGLLALMPSAGFSIEKDGALAEAVARPIGSRTLMAEVDEMIERYNSLVKNANDLINTIVKEKRNEALITQAQQVAHDIRSPLAAFNVVLPELTALPEDTRTMLRHAIFRIQGMADTLLRSAQRTQSDANETSSTEAVMISSLVESVVCEKRVQYRDRPHVSIETAAHAHGYGLFCRVSLPGELKRVLSNLINNAVEAVPSRGAIAVSVHGDAKHVWVEIRDDGPGIPDDILASVGQRGLTIGKANGHGLGLFHACSTLADWGGSLSFSKPPEGGTVVKVMLPRATAPSWFLPALDLEGIARVLVVDDDLSIHGIWDERFTQQGADALPRLHFSASSDFLSWSLTHQEWGATTYVLMDYELIGSSKNGLDLLAEAKTFTRRALVTSRTEELSVKARAEQLGVQMVPKEVAAYIPIRKPESISKQMVKAIVIDDDILVHQSWKMALGNHAENVRFYTTVHEFLTVVSSFTKSVPVFIDKNLADHIDGLDVASDLAALGFSEIYIQTGNEPDLIPAVPYIRGVIGKAPPDWLVAPYKESRFHPRKGG